MKKLTIIILLSFIGISQISAQGFEQNISFDKFVTWANEIAIENMEIESFYENGDYENGESISYSVDFANENARISIGIQSMEEYELYAALSDESFFMDGFSMMYINYEEGGYCILCISNSDLNALLTIHAMPTLSKEEILKIYESIQIGKLLF
jgi:hypothetical protein